MDQIAAKQIGRDTQLPSLELAMDLNPLAGVCNNGYACVYQNCLSWSSPTTPLPSEAHPRIVFERLFGEGGNSAERRAALQGRASLLDSFSADIARLKRRVGIPTLHVWISISKASARSSGRFSAPRPVPWTTRCPTWTAR